jgi:hypothetical protein
MVAGGRLDNEKHGGGEGRELAGDKIVELDKPYAASARTYREIEAIGVCGVEQGKKHAAEIRRADAGDMNRVEPALIVGLRLRAAERL